MARSESTCLTIMVTIANCRDWQETQLLKSNLESIGINVFVPDEMSNLDGMIMYFGGFRVQVAEEDAAEARVVLESLPKLGEATEPGSARKGGAATPADNSGATKWPPSVS